MPLTLTIWQCYYVDMTDETLPTHDEQLEEVLTGYLRQTEQFEVVDHSEMIA